MLASLAMIISPAAERLALDRKRLAAVSTNTAEPRISPHGAVHSVLIRSEAAVQ